MNLTNDELARLYHRKLKLPSGHYNAPCADVTWDGRFLHMHGTGVALDAVTAAQWPEFAQLLSAPVFAGEPAITALVDDYAAATSGRQGAVSESVFTARLAACRDCLLWDEAARNGQGSCASIHAACACRRLWMAAETCPEAKWPA